MEEVQLWLEQAQLAISAWLAGREEEALSIAGVIGTLIGALTFLMHVVVNTKDEQIKELHRERDDLAEDRDFWRDVALGTTTPSGKQAWLDARAEQVQGAKPQL